MPGKPCEFGSHSACNRHIHLLTARGRETWVSMQSEIRTYYADALQGFSTAESLPIFHLLDRLRTGLARIDGPSD